MTVNHDPDQDHLPGISRRSLLGACMAGHSAMPEFIATYVSFDGGASWRSNGDLPLPAPVADRRR